MNNNDVLRSIRYALDLSEPAIVDMIKSSEHEIDRTAVSALLKKEDEEGYVECGDAILSAFLDGLIVQKRGKIEPRPEQANKPNARLNNNTILKKLRIAFELKEEDIHGILEQAGFAISKPELNALFRKKGHKNYRECGDQILRNFLKGLTGRLRG
ncbi:MAG: DUF1456 family protein [Sulfuricella sp.]|nr:DUF1456 family protein [Sulfuricella sp.]